MQRNCCIYTYIFRLPAHIEHAALNRADFHHISCMRRVDHLASAYVYPGMSGPYTDISRLRVAHSRPGDNIGSGPCMRIPSRQREADKS